MKIKQLLAKMMLVGSLVLGSTVVMAQTPSDNSLITLAKISDFDNAFQDGMKHGFISSFTQGILNNPNIQQLPINKKAKVEKLAEEMGNKVLKDIATVDLTQKMLDDFLIIAKQHYTQQEVDAMIEFYSTPIGKSIVSKQNIVMMEFSNQALKTVENDKKFQQTIKASVEKHLPDFEKQLENVLKK